MLPISVVIATLGGKCLEETLSRLRNGSAAPDEILICVPVGVATEAHLVEDSCLQVVRTPCRGQVAQRAYGLAMVRNLFVLQMDDDVGLPSSALIDLFDLCDRVGAGNAVAPLFTHCKSGEYLTTYRDDFRGYLQSLSASLIGGALWGARRMGRIDRAGIPYAVDKAHCHGEKLVETEWLPGGCVICRKEDLVLDNYFPFPGKAYSEDVIHSLLWRKRGVSLWVAPEISVCTHVEPISATLKHIRADYQARAFVVNLIGGSLFRCRLWFVTFFLRRLLARCFGGRA